MKSIVCFKISPEYRGKGIAAQLLKRVCTDAEAEGYDCVEAYPVEGAQSSLAFTGVCSVISKNELLRVFPNRQYNHYEETVRESSLDHMVEKETEKYDTEEETEL